MRRGGTGKFRGRGKKKKGRRGLVISKNKGTTGKGPFTLVITIGPWRECERYPRHQ